MKAVDLAGHLIALPDDTEVVIDAGRGVGVLPVRWVGMGTDGKLGICVAVPDGGSFKRGEPEDRDGAYVHPDEHERVKRELAQEREYLNGYIEWALSERDGTTPELTGLEAVKMKMARALVQRDQANREVREWRDAANDLAQADPRRGVRAGTSVLAYFQEKVPLIAALWADHERLEAERDSPEAYPRPLFLRFDDYEWVVRERDAAVSRLEFARVLLDPWQVLGQMEAPAEKVGAPRVAFVKAKMARLESERDDARAGRSTLQDEFAAALDHRDEWRTRAIGLLPGRGIFDDYDNDASVWRRLLETLAGDSTLPVRAVIALALRMPVDPSLTAMLRRFEEVAEEARQAIEHGDKVHAAGVEEGRRLQRESRDEPPFIPASWKLVAADPALGAMAFERPDGTMVHWAEGVWSGVSDSRHLSVDP